MFDTALATLLSEKDLCDRTQLSRFYWSDRRKDGSLIEGVHYLRIGSRNLRYCLELILGGLIFGFKSREHQRTCERFLEVDRVCGVNLDEQDS